MQRTLSEVIFEKRKQSLQQKPLTKKRILPLVTQYHPSVTENWHNYNRTTTIAQRNLQRTSSIFIQKRQVPQRYTRESKTKTAVTRMSESRRPLTILQNTVTRYDRMHRRHVHATEEKHFYEKTSSHLAFTFD